MFGNTNVVRVVVEPPISDKILPKCGIVSPTIIIKQIIEVLIIHRLILNSEIRIIQYGLLSFPYIKFEVLVVL